MHKHFLSRWVNQRLLNYKWLPSHTYMRSHASHVHKNFLSGWINQRLLTASDWHLTPTCLHMVLISTCLTSHFKDLVVMADWLFFADPKDGSLLVFGWLLPFEGPNFVQPLCSHATTYKKMILHSLRQWRVKILIQLWLAVIYIFSQVSCSNKIVIYLIHILFYWWLNLWL